MLVEFSVTNFRSIRDKQTLSMVKGKGSEHEATHTFKPTAPGSETLLKSAAIYGANAAGKSNLLKALKIMRSMVLEPAARYEEVDDGVLGFVGIREYQPFIFENLLNFIATPIPTDLEIIFIKDAVRYQYGFSFDSNRIIDEWLFAFPKGRSQRWFEREFKEEFCEHEWSFGESLLGDKQHWVRATHETNLFLYEAKSIEQLQVVRNWFKENIIEIDDLFEGSTDSDESIRETARLLLSRKGNRKKQIEKILYDLDTGVDGIGVYDVGYIASGISSINNHNEDDLLTALDEETIFSKPVEVTVMEKQKKYRLYSTHVVNGEKHLLDFSEESEGTRKIIRLAVRLLGLLERGCTVVIDEISNSFHPMLVRYLIELFHSEKFNMNNAQLIFTTHEVSVLDQDIFRRDQVWFCEKDANQATRLYSLLDFKPRKGYENLEAAYLSGRYGAIPLINGV